MAKAKKTVDTIELEIAALQLTLTDYEATVLRAILGNVGGQQNLAPRKAINDVIYAMSDAGYDHNCRDRVPEVPNYNEDNRAIYFRER